MAKQRFSSVFTEEQHEKEFTEFQDYLKFQNKSAHTIRAYLFTVRQFFELYQTVTPEHLLLYKCYLIDHYKPQTVNLRIRAINCYVEFQKLSYPRLLMVRHKQKPFLENVISQADYEYLKSRLLQDEKMTTYYAVWIMASTGLRISELIQLQVSDLQLGHMDIHSKGERFRRIYIPRPVRSSCIHWLASINRQTGDVFLNRYGKRISAAGIRDLLKRSAILYHLDPSVVHPHAFRHLFAKNFIERCNDIAMLSDILGHESVETTRIYLHRSSSEQQFVFNQIVVW